MELDAFTSRLGLGQGRVAPANAIPGSGDHVFVLGEDEPGRFFDLAAGDHAEVVQDTDLTDVALVRAHLRLRVPASLPSTHGWEASIVVDGVKAARATCRAGRERLLTDLAANVSKLTGLHEVGVRLELVEV
ncbi:MAG: hypothetical protein ACOY3Y_13310 [Acidobacteriota bacterium]